MKKLSTTIKDYTLNEKCFQLQIPMNLNVIIPENDSVRLLSQFVEEMDLTCLYDTYSILKENQVTPRQMLKIVLYAYLDGRFSSREIEKACRRDINFMYLLEGKPVPDHATIARFRSLHFAPCAKLLLAQCSELLYELGEISGKNIFIDGTKIEANANKYTFVWKRAVTKNQEKLGNKAAALVAECVETYALKPVWGCSDCKECPVKSKCIKGNNWKIPEEERFKSLEVSRTFEQQRKECLERITSDQGILLRINRSIQVEGSFADLKWDRGFRRFLCRGNANVFAECVLLAISHNIEKLHNKIQNGTVGKHLHCEDKIA